MLDKVARSILTGLLALLAWAAVAPPARADETRPVVHVVSFGLFGAQDLFRREANAAASVIADHWGRSGQVVVRTNDAMHSEADMTELEETLDDLAHVIDRRNDVLVLFLTSHGNTNGLVVVKRGVRRVAFITPLELKRVLAASGIQHRIVIVSACYSGVFADRLADDDTLVITAADFPHHSSFGCSDSNPGNYTWFGQAFFAESFRPGVAITDAFHLAYRRVSLREALENFPKSNPQLRGGANVLAQVRQAP